MIRKSRPCSIHKSGGVVQYFKTLVHGDIPDHVNAEDHLVDRVAQVFPSRGDEPHIAELSGDVIGRVHAARIIEDVYPVVDREIPSKIHGDQDFSIGTGNNEGLVTGGIDFFLFSGHLSIDGGARGPSFPSMVIRVLRSEKKRPILKGISMKVSKKKALA